LQVHQLADAFARQFQQRHQLLFAERRAFGSTLNLHQSARAGQNKISVGLGGRVLVVIKIENRHSLDDAATDGRDMILDHRRRHQTGLLHEGHALSERDEAAGDGGGAGPAVGLQHIAVDGDLAFTQRRQIAHRTQGAAYQALNLLGAARLFAGGGLAPHAIMGGAGQHAIFRRHPALARALQKGRGFFFQAGGDQNMGVAEFDQTGAFGMAGKAGGQGNGAHLIGGAVGRAHGASYIGLLISGVTYRSGWPGRNRN